ncbi:LGFP repeat-containing protein [Arthrobacter sp. SA17]
MGTHRIRKRPLGYPVSALICGIRDNGCYQAYQRGEILWSPATGAQPSTPGAIRNKYRAAGAENSGLGYPTSSEICGIRNAGCFQTYQNGEILWSPPPEHRSQNPARSEPPTARTAQRTDPSATPPAASSAASKTTAATRASKTERSSSTPPPGHN